METLQWIIDRLFQWKNIKLEIRTAAVEGLSPAVATTIHYVTERSRGKERDLDLERELFQLWYAASAAVCRLDQQLGKDCIAKAEYWLFRDNFDERNDYKIDELNIRLKRMKSVLDKLKYQ